ncbi:hypothetical protein [Riemerella columbipharyngis]|uniref:Uncharacterized protein n=1 Tax=Riemerella columbipharyngis TaxID=1071918 RepID=A0A1G7AXX8_9FLAO|nr:hypothetical protein [Riemerella columbipharyngis]SDE19621.1 hypothetical protein SAMN05421544_104140 [Riemerella columbipharyngis]
MNNLAVMPVNQNYLLFVGTENAVEAVDITKEDKYTGKRIKI